MLQTHTTHAIAASLQMYVKDTVDDDIFRMQQRKHEQIKAILVEEEEDASTLMHVGGDGDNDDGEEEVCDGDDDDDDDDESGGKGKAKGKGKGKGKGAGKGKGKAKAKGKGRSDIASPEGKQEIGVIGQILQAALLRMNAKATGGSSGKKV